MDGIPGYPTATRSLTGPTTLSHSSASNKTTSAYLRALRRRCWIVLAIGVPLSILSGIWIARQPNVYSARTQIKIEAPQFDPVLASLVSPNVGHSDPERSETYGANRIMMLRNPGLALAVVRDPSLGINEAGLEDAAQELVSSIQTRPIQGTNLYTVSLEGTDPARAAKMLQILIELFREEASAEINKKFDDAKSTANDHVESLKREHELIQKKSYAMIEHSEIIGPNGTNLKQAKYDLLRSGLQHDEYQVRELRLQSMLSKSPGRFGFNDPNTRTSQEYASLEALRQQYTESLENLITRVRNLNDPSVRFAKQRLDNVLKQMKKIEAAAAKENGEEVLDPYEAIIASHSEDLRQLRATTEQAREEMQQSMPTHQEFLDIQDELRIKSDQIAAMESKLREFDAVSKVKKEPVVHTEGQVVEPTQPIRPKRALNMIFALVFSFGLGIGLVCLLEHVDHAVNSPEQLTAGLGLPLFGVVPRIKRSAALHRGGHLWTPGVPDSIEADAYRNLRASLLGVTDKRGPIVTLLVTSAKAGEGKSTTALNLAATCARAGERTLLMDVDLRRPSLANVFEHLEDEPNGLGLVDVLRGDLPWQRTVVRTDIPNLDFLPTGDTNGIPVEILGTLELRQLLIGLSSHYDRVILDGPAILGLADCRMLGRVVDASLMVVRSGFQELRPLQHAKSMLEQSHVTIAGVVFNGLFEDLKNWSSYGPDTFNGEPASLPGRDPGRTLGLTAPKEEQEALQVSATS